MPPSSSAVPRRAVLPVGFHGYERAPSSMAKCLVCGANIQKGAWRLNYRVKATNTLRDARRLHAECSSGLPQSNRMADRQLVEGWLGEARGRGAGADEIEMLATTLAALGADHVGRLASGGPAAGSARV